MLINARLMKKLVKVVGISSEGVAEELDPCYNDRMTNSNNGSTTRTRTGSRKGPKPIQSLADLKANLLRDALSKEMRKIDRKIAVEERKRNIAHKRANASTEALKELERIRAEFLRESGIKA